MYVRPRRHAPPGAVPEPEGGEGGRLLVQGHIPIITKDNTMYVCVCMYMYIHIYIYIHMYVYIYIYIYNNLIIHMSGWHFEGGRLLVQGPGLPAEPPRHRNT